MPHNLTPVSEYTGNVSVPVGGDPRTALSVEVPFQTLTNRAAWLRDQTLELQYKGVTRQIATEAYSPINFIAPYVLSGGGGPYWRQLSTPTANDHVVYRLGMPQGATLNSITVRLQGAAAHVGLPASVPTLRLLRVDATDFTSGWVLQGSISSDLSANTTAYQAVHTITVGSLSVVVDNAQYNYFACVSGEGSTNALSGLLVSSQILGVFAA
jgi:hypothetical protein